ncbi:sacsin N-terminal ATP-binding-like domain-containing protein [Acidimangrovimonas pyrenivorans]|uniref:Sacsin N-terminal ATP-binding-like domain-containing protein n=1 Tax=Acidimangrovimonas pyrenivorans TaxID=2030798 RepID=A0ABV7AD34_9RHOB
MTDFLTKLSEQRRKFLEGLDANEGDINLDIFEDFYPDQAHFVFELLQNAEDAEATEVSFSLSEDGCLFEHNGKRLFTERDVRSITGIHNSTKEKSSDEIGKFGVGFKSVFVYTLAPEIRSGDFAFRISRLVMPERIDDDGGDRAVTRFWFPFNNPKKPKDTAFGEVRAGLRDLAETTLLFLSNIHAINWRIDDGQAGSILRIEHSDEHIEVLKESGGSTTATSHFLRFSETAEGLERQKVSVAFSLEPSKEEETYQSGTPLSKQFKIVPVNGQVAVFFPAEKEKSNLRFHLHAPFVPELSRASIKRDLPANEPLFKQLASMSVAAMRGIKEMGLLTPDFLGVLPNNSDDLGKQYKTIREKITEAFNDEPLTPTFRKGHAPAKHLLQAKASLKELLAQEDIEFLVDYKSVAPQWAASRALQGTNVERFMSGLDINEWDVDDFLEVLADKLDASYTWSPPDEDFLKWLSKKPVEWMQQLYALLASEPETKDELDQLSDAKIVRLMDGSLGIPKECYFPDDHNRYSKIVPCVDRELLEGGTSQKRKKFTRVFLSEIGVSEIGERELVEALLEKEYASTEHVLKEKEHAAHLRRFMKLLEKEPSARLMLQEHRIFLGDDMQWHKPGDINLDSPYLDTGLSEYYEALGLSSKTVQLHSLYQNLPIDTPKIAGLAKSLGARTAIPVKKSSCTNNPDWSYLCRVAGERNTSPINDDYVMIGFERLISKKSIRVSRLIWNSMCQLGERHLEARFRRNVSGGSRYAKSQLVHQLRDTAWVPQGDTFVKPSAARAGLLPEGFSFDAGSPWIKAIDFGGDVARESEEARAQAAAAQARKTRRQAAAAELGFENPDDLEWLSELSELSESERLEIREEMRRRKTVPDLPENEPSNPERRDARVREIAKDAQGRETEKRSRSISIGQGAVKEEAKQYLQHQYTGDEGLFCQVCEKPMPFVLDDGSPYFEAVEFLQEKELKKRHHQNYLALCPNHAAMFRHANGSKDIMKAMLLDLDDARLEVILAQADCTIYFTKTHLADLKSAIHAEDEGENVRASSG